MEDFKEFGYTEKPQHTLQDLAGMGILGIAQGSGRGLRVPGFVAMLPRFRGCFIVLRLMDLWTGLGLGREFGVARAHVSRLCMIRGSN